MVNNDASIDTEVGYNGVNADNTFQGVTEVGSHSASILNSRNDKSTVNSDINSVHLDAGKALDIFLLDRDSVGDVCTLPTSNRFTMLSQLEGYTDMGDVGEVTGLDPVL